MATDYWKDTVNRVEKELLDLAHEDKSGTVIYLTSEKDNGEIHNLSFGEHVDVMDVIFSTAIDVVRDGIGSEGLIKLLSEAIKQEADKLKNKKGEK